MKLKNLSFMLALAAACSWGKSEAEENVDVMRDVFGQTRLAVDEVNGVIVSYAKGFSRTVWENYEVEPGRTNQHPVSVSYPLLLESATSGFAYSHVNFPAIADIAINRDLGRVYASMPSETNCLFQINLSGISTNNMLSGKLSLTPVMLHDSNDPDSSYSSCRADKIVSWGDWLLMTSKEGIRNMSLYHVNGVINCRKAFSGIIANEYCQNDDTLYISDKEKTLKISKLYPTNGVEYVSSPKGGVVGLGVVGNDLYQATSSAVYKGEDISKSYVISDIQQITGLSSSKNASKLVLSCDPTREFSVSNFHLEGAPVLKVTGGHKVFATHAGVFVLVRNQMMKVCE